MPPVTDNEQPDNEVPSSSEPEAVEQSSGAEPQEQPTVDSPAPAELASDKPADTPDSPLSSEPAHDESASASEPIPVVVSSSTDATTPAASPATDQAAAPQPAVVAPTTPVSVPPVAAAQPVLAAGKSYPVTVVLSFLFGVLGVDRFYLGKIWTGVLKLITFGGIGFWYMYDLVITAFNKQTDKNGNPLSDYEQYKILGYVLVGLAVIGVLVGAIRH